jgi:hypothetical protein
MARRSFATTPSTFLFRTAASRRQFLTASRLSAGGDHFAPGHWRDSEELTGGKRSAGRAAIILVKQLYRKVFKKGTK